MMDGLGLVQSLAPDLVVRLTLGQWEGSLPPLCLLVSLTLW